MISACIFSTKCANIFDSISLAISWPVKFQEDGRFERFPLVAIVAVAAELLAGRLVSEQRWECRVSSVTWA